jgi:uncharacterized membrane protein
MKTKNLETRIANRLKSVFAAFGQTINDFYLEAGIYFVGGFNAALVAWDIYTSLASDGQPLAYAIALAVIAFIAVEGLAVYLVGAAAKTGNGWLWFFSVIFAAFFTYAHYREMSGPGVIAQYITLAIPPFVVIGYWARTVKIDVESSQAQTAQQRDDEIARQRQIEDEKRQYQIEQARLNAEQKRAEEAKAAEHSRNKEQREADLKHAEKMARIEAKVKAQVSESVKPVVKDTVKPFTVDGLKEALQADGKPNLTQLAKDLHISRPTLYKRLNDLVDSGEVVKNGNGYELP